MSIEIELDAAAEVEPVPLTEAARLALRLLQQPPGVALSILVTDNETLQALNAQYRGIDAPTDVLSFGNSPDPDFPPDFDEAVAGYLGDILIAYPVAQAQAAAAGHTLLDELRLLVVHGVLHLCGYDHDTPTNKAAMWELQAQVMAELGLAHVQPTET